MREIDGLLNNQKLILDQNYVKQKNDINIALYLKRIEALGNL